MYRLQDYSYRLTATAPPILFAAKQLSLPVCCTTRQEQSLPVNSLYAHNSIPHHVAASLKPQLYPIHNLNRRKVGSSLHYQAMEVNKWSNTGHTMVFKDRPQFHVDHLPVVFGGSTSVALGGGLCGCGVPTLATGQSSWIVPNSFHSTPAINKLGNSISCFQEILECKMNRDRDRDLKLQ